jgi:hypothetical protein
MKENEGKELNERLKPPKGEIKMGRTYNDTKTKIRVLYIPE